MDVKSTSVRDAILRVPRTKLKEQHIIITSTYSLQVREDALKNWGQ